MVSNQLRVLGVIGQHPRKKLITRSIVAQTGLAYIQVCGALQTMYHHYGYVSRDANGEWLLTEKGVEYLAAGHRRLAPGRRGRILVLSSDDVARLKAAVRSGLKSSKALMTLRLAEGKRVKEIAKEFGVLPAAVSKVKSILINAGIDAVLPKADFELRPGRDADALAILMELETVRKQLGRIEGEVRSYIRYEKLKKSRA